jgi:hypothetical protein
MPTSTSNYVNISGDPNSTVDQTGLVTAVMGSAPMSSFSVTMQPGTTCPTMFALSSAPTLAVVPRYCNHYCAGDGCSLGTSGSGKDTQLYNSYAHTEMCGIGFFMEQPTATGTAGLKVHLNDPNDGGADVYVGVMDSAGNPPLQTIIQNMTTNTNSASGGAGANAIALLDMNGNFLQQASINYWEDGTNPQIANTGRFLCANDTTTGTKLNRLVASNGVSANTCVITPAAVSEGAIGVAISGSATIASRGLRCSRFPTPRY